jgi:hypothetical protein
MSLSFGLTLQLLQPNALRQRKSLQTLAASHTHFQVFQNFTFHPLSRSCSSHPRDFTGLALSNTAPIKIDEDPVFKDRDGVAGMKSAVSPPRPGKAVVGATGDRDIGAGLLRQPSCCSDFRLPIMFAERRRRSPERRGVREAEGSYKHAPPPQGLKLPPPPELQEPEL